MCSSAHCLSQTSSSSNLMITLHDRDSGSNNVIYVNTHALGAKADDSSASGSGTPCFHDRLPPLALEAPRGQAKHALFCDSSGFRRDHIYLDDDLTREQLEGRRSLRARKLELKGAGNKTWWRRGVLHWADHDGFHSQSPP